MEVIGERIRGDLRAADKLADGVEIIVNTSPVLPAQLALLERLLRRYRQRRYRSERIKQGE